MSNDELQKAIDDITSGDNAPENAAPTTESVDEGVASVSLPNEAAMVDDDATKQTEAAMNELEKMTGVAPAPGVGEMPMMPPVENEVTEESAAAEIKAAAEAAANEQTAPVPDVPDTTPPLGGQVGGEHMESMVLPSVPEMPPVLNEEVKMPELSEDGPKDPDLKEVETAALIELYPLLSKMNVNAREKFDICVKVLDKTGEKGATSAALDAAKEIADEKERGECLIQLVELIEKM